MFIRAPSPRQHNHNVQSYFVNIVTNIMMALRHFAFNHMIKTITRIFISKKVLLTQIIRLFESMLHFITWSTFDIKTCKVGLFGLSLSHYVEWQTESSQDQLSKNTWMSSSTSFKSSQQFLDFSCLTLNNFSFDMRDSWCTEVVIGNQNHTLWRER